VGDLALETEEKPNKEKKTVVGEKEKADERVVR